MNSITTAEAKINNQQREINHLKSQKQSTVDFLKTLSKEVGMHWGPEVEKHIASLTSGSFNASNWNVADTNGEQGR